MYIPRLRGGWEVPNDGVVGTSSGIPRDDKSTDIPTSQYSDIPLGSHRTGVDDGDYWKYRSEVRKRFTGVRVVGSPPTFYRT